MALANCINIYLLRHGKTLGEPALYGHTDIGVSAERQQGICHSLMGEQLGFESLLTSPLTRCRDLAELINAQHHGLDYRIAPEWQETSFGDLDGVPFEQAKQSWPLFEAFWQEPANNTLPNAEPLDIFYQRISTAWDQFMQTVEKDTLIVCHGGTIRMILAKVLNLDWHNPALYASLNIAHQSLTHIQIIKAEKDYLRVCMIGKPLNG